MEHSEKELTAYCGLYCGDCIRYKSRASGPAYELLKEIDTLHFKEYAKVKRIHMKAFEHVDAVISLLKAILETNCDIPCRLGGDGCGGTCKIIQCVKNKSYDGCWECDEFTKCKKFDFLKPFHANGPINNLKIIKTHGLSDWAKYRDKCYPWVQPQRKT